MWLPGLVPYREISKKRNPVSTDTGDAAASPLVQIASLQSANTNRETTYSARCDSVARQQLISLGKDEESVQPPEESEETSQHKNKGDDPVSPEQLAAWHEEIEEVRNAEQHAWRSLQAAEAALAAAGHGWGSGRDGLVLQRQEVSRIYGQERIRRKAYELLVSLVEQGVSKDEAIERTLEAYPHLRREPEDALALERAAEAEVPAGPEEPCLEAWSLLTEEQWRRALFGQLCHLWQWPTGTALNEEARGRLNRACKTLLKARLRPEYIPLFVAWWNQRYHWRTHALPWELTSSVNDFLQWQEAHQAWNLA